VAVADPLLERAQEVAGVHQAPAYADYRDLLDAVDAVWICTPPYLHREQAETCAAAGKHLFIEKPLALTLADCQAIVDIARAYKVKLAVGQVFHFYPVFQEAHRRFEAGELGDLISCWSKRMAYSPASEMPEWRTDPRRGGGYTVENQVHELDFVAWFGGEPVSVRAVVARSDPRYPTFDSSMAAIVTFRNGSIGEVSGSWLSHVAVSQRGVVGTRGGIVIDAWDRLRLKIDGRDEQIVGTPHPGEAVRAEDEHLLYCIERDEEPRVSGALGLQAVELALATLASSDQSAVIGLPMPR
jgi:predicted dehydrogenase